MEETPSSHRVFRVLPGLIDMTLGGVGARYVYALFAEDTTAEYVEGSQGPEYGVVRIFSGDEEIRRLDWSGAAVKNAIAKKPDVFRVVIHRIQTDMRSGLGRIWTIDRIVEPKCGLAIGFVRAEPSEKLELPPWVSREITHDEHDTSLGLLRRYRKLLQLVQSVSDD